MRQKQFCLKQYYFKKISDFKMANKVLKKLTLLRNYIRLVQMFQ